MAAAAESMPMPEQISRIRPPDGTSSAKFMASSKGVKKADVAAFECVAPSCQSERMSAIRSEERRVGKGCVSPCRSWWSPYHSKKEDRKHCKCIHTQST